MMLTDVPKPFRAVEEIETLLGEMAFVPGEIPGLSALDHGLQCAAALARMAVGDHELAIAGLVHDIGHEGADDAHHADFGADAVETVLGPRVAELVRLHVAAKRYLVATDDNYFARLSLDSVRTLDLQGGPMTAAECAIFESFSHWRDAIRLRLADEDAKTPGRPVPDLEHWLPALRDVARANVRS